MTSLMIEVPPLSRSGVVVLPRVASATPSAPAANPACGPLWRRQRVAVSAGRCISRTATAFGVRPACRSLKEGGVAGNMGDVAVRRRPHPRLRCQHAAQAAVKPVIYQCVPNHQRRPTRVLTTARTAPGRTAKCAAASSQRRCCDGGSQRIRVRRTFVGTIVNVVVEDHHFSVFDGIKELSLHA